MNICRTLDIIIDALHHFLQQHNYIHHLSNPDYVLDILQSLLLGLFYLILPVSLRKVVILFPFTDEGSGFQRGGSHLPGITQLLSDRFWLSMKNSLTIKTVSKWGGFLLEEMRSLHSELIKLETPSIDLGYFSGSRSSDIQR